MSDLSRKRRRTSVSTYEDVAPPSNPMRTTPLSVAATVPDRTYKEFSLYAQKKVVLATGAGSEAQNVIDFTPFSLYDHDSSGASGVQPYGLDQWNTFYDRYRVTTAIIDMTITPDNTWNTSADFGAYFAAVVTQSGSPPSGLSASTMTPTTLRQHQHDQKVKWFLTRPTGAAGTGGPVRPRYKMRLVLSGKRIWKMTKPDYLTDDDTAALFNANPVKNPVVNLFVMTGDGSEWAIATAVLFTYKITYRCQLIDRKLLPVSTK